MLHAVEGSASSPERSLLLSATLMDSKVAAGVLQAVLAGALAVCGSLCVAVQGWVALLALQPLCDLKLRPILFGASCFMLVTTIKVEDDEEDDWEGKPNGRFSAGNDAEHLGISSEMICKWLSTGWWFALGQGRFNHHQ